MKRPLLKVISVAMSITLAYSASAHGLQAMSNQLIPLVAARLQGPPAQYCGSTPGVINYGPSPARDEMGRNGIWDVTNREILGNLYLAATAERDLPVLSSSYDAAPNVAGSQPAPEETQSGDTQAQSERTPRGPMASSAEATPQGQSIIADPGVGQPMPWEAAFPGGGSSSAPAIVNSNTGNRLTTVHLYSFGVRGGMELGFTLYHNSKRGDWDSTIGRKWSSN